MVRLNYAFFSHGCPDQILDQKARFMIKPGQSTFFQFLPRGSKARRHPKISEGESSNALQTVLDQFVPKSGRGFLFREKGSLCIIRSSSTNFSAFSLETMRQSWKIIEWHTGFQSMNDTMCLSLKMTETTDCERKRACFLCMYFCAFCLYILIMLTRVSMREEDD